MDTDPRANVVVFRLRRGRQLVERVPARAEDGVRQAWDAVVRGQKVRARQVTGLHAEWEPTAEDAAFIADTFPGVPVTHHFERPGADGWDDAFAAAAVVLQAELRPALWSESRAGRLSEVPYWPVAAGRLRLALAVVTPNAMYHVTHDQFGAASFDELMAATCQGLAAGLDVTTRDDGVLTASGRLVAAVACLPDFSRRLAELTGEERLVVGLPDQDTILVAAAGGPADVVEREALASPAEEAGELVPCVLSVEGDRIVVVAEQT